jgi:type II secretory pathway component HofQ
LGPQGISPSMTRRAPTGIEAYASAFFGERTASRVRRIVGFRSVNTRRRSLRRPSPNASANRRGGAPLFFPARNRSATAARPPPTRQEPRDRDPLAPPRNGQPQPRSTNMKTSRGGLLPRRLARPPILAASHHVKAVTMQPRPRPLQDAAADPKLALWSAATR